MNLIVILAVSLLIAVVGLGFQIGVASWNIRRANRYRREASSANRNANYLEGRLAEDKRQIENLYEYGSDLLWFITFLYRKYDSFSMIEKEFEEGIQAKDGETVEDVNLKYQDLKEAMRIIKKTAVALDKLDSTISLIKEIVEVSLEKEVDIENNNLSDTVENSSITKSKVK